MISQVKKQQQKIFMILDSKKIPYTPVDICQDEKDKVLMREIVGDEKALPPQICNGRDYCGVSLTRCSHRLIIRHCHTVTCSNGGYGWEWWACPLDIPWLKTSRGVWMRQIFTLNWTAASQRHMCTHAHTHTHTHKHKLECEERYVFFFLSLNTHLSKDTPKSPSQCKHTQTHSVFSKCFKTRGFVDQAEADIPDMEIYCYRYGIKYSIHFSSTVFF